jgi:hypothetical protein
MRGWALAAGMALSVLIGAVATGQQADGGEPLKWFKGNTHTHSLNSDGDSTPDEVVQWYREQRYHFLFFTDHNTVTPVDGLNAVFAAPDRFLVIRGEEITDSAEKKPVHLNMLGGGARGPQGGATPAKQAARRQPPGRAGVIQSPPEPRARSRRSARAAPSAGVNAPPGEQQGRGPARHRRCGTAC